MDANLPPGNLVLNPPAASLPDLQPNLANMLLVICKLRAKKLPYLLHSRLTLNTLSALLIIDDGGRAARKEKKGQNGGRLIKLSYLLEICLN